MRYIPEGNADVHGSPVTKEACIRFLESYTIQ